MEPNTRLRNAANFVKNKTVLKPGLEESRFLRVVAILMDTSYCLGCVPFQRDVGSCNLTNSVQLKAHTSRWTYAACHLSTWAMGLYAVFCICRLETTWELYGFTENFFIHAILTLTYTFITFLKFNLLIFDDEAWSCWNQIQTLPGHFARFHPSFATTSWHLSPTVNIGVSFMIVVFILNTIFLEFKFLLEPTKPQYLYSILWESLPSSNLPIQYGVFGICILLEALLNIQNAACGLVFVLMQTAYLFTINPGLEALRDTSVLACSSWRRRIRMYRTLFLVHRLFTNYCKDVWPAVLVLNVSTVVSCTVALLKYTDLPLPLTLLLLACIIWGVALITMIFLTAAEIWTDSDGFCNTAFASFTVNTQSERKLWRQENRTLQPFGMQIGPFFRVRVHHVQSIAEADMSCTLLLLQLG